MPKVDWKRLSQWLTDRKDRSLARRALLTLLLVGPALAFIAYQTWTNWGQLRSYQWEVRPWLWGLGFLGYSAALTCLLVAWSYLIGRLGGKARFRTNARVYCLSGLSKRIPGFIWYMAGRALLYREEGVPASISVIASALELALTATVGLLTFFLMLPFVGNLPQQDTLLIVAVALLAVGAVILQPAIFNRIVGFFLRRLGSQAQVRVTYRDILPTVPLYLLAWAIGGGMLYVVIQSVYQLPLEMLPSIIGIWAASGTLTMLLSSFLFGMGVREVTLSLLLTVLLPQPMAVVVALLFGLIFVLSELAWAGIFALLR